MEETPSFLEDIDPGLRTLMLAAKDFTRLLGQSLRTGDQPQLKPPEAMLLWQLVRAEAEGGLQPSRLSAAMGVSPGHITQLLTALEERGLVERRPDPDDRRAVRVFRTPAGEAAMLRFHELFVSIFTGLQAALGNQDCARLAAILERANAYLRTTAKDAEPPRPGMRGHPREDTCSC
jgi:DNA-binding MarR family transcriptional regulator